MCVVCIQAETFGKPESNPKSAPIVHTCNMPQSAWPETVLTHAGGRTPAAMLNLVKSAVVATALAASAQQALAQPGALHSLLFHLFKN